MKNVTTSLMMVFAAGLVSWNASAAFAQKPINIAPPDDTSDMHPSWDFPEIDESMSVKECISGAEKGNADAQIELALRYFFGKGVKKDMEETLELAKKSANQGNGKALYFLAFIENAFNHHERANSLVKLAAENGYVLAQARMGIIKFSEGNYAQSYQWHLKAAKQGYLQSCYECGLYLLAGEGVEQNMEEAVRWFRVAAEGGHMRAQFELGVCYAQGEGVKQSYEESFKWITKSAEKNHPRSLLILGMYYIKGMGVDQDVEKGYNCLVKAANLGSKDAQAILKQLNSQQDDEDED